MIFLKEISWLYSLSKFLYLYILTRRDLLINVLICFYRYGEITNLNLVRDKDTGKQKGFCFVCYEDQRSTVLAVDNFNGTRVLGRILRVDHVKDYKPPKSSEPISKIKTEKPDDDDFQVKREIKTEIKQEVLTPDIKREICTPNIKPEIKQEICTPEIKREICTPEIIKSPDNKSDKKKKDKDKDHKKKKDSRDKYKEKNVHYKHQKERFKEKDRKKYNTSEQDRSREREISNKRPRYNHSQERDIISNDLTIKSYKEHYNKNSNVRNDSHSRYKASEKDENQFKDDRKSYKNKDYSKKDSKKHHR